MSEISEGFAELGQGTLAAASVEPAAAGTGLDGLTHEHACLNCGTALVGSHCHACGQAAHVHRTLGAFFHDLLHGVFHFEGKVWRTLPLLVVQPGRLTREYIDGRRASYVSPIALFLFFVFLMFAVFQATEDHQVGANVAAQGNTSVGVDAGITKLKAEIAQLRARKADASAKGQPTEAIEAQIADRREALDTLGVLKSSAVIKIPDAKSYSDVPQFDRAVRKFMKNPDLAAYKLQTYAYKYSWALIPISVPFVWLLFPFSRRFHLYDHTVFVTYSLCFMTLLMIVGTLAEAIGADAVIAVLMFLPPVHMHRQLRGAYGLRFRSALWRTALLLLFATTALLIFFMLIMAQTV